MITEEMEDILIERILRRQEKANERILEELGKILGEIGELTPSEAYTIGQQLKFGESLDKIIKLISKTSGINEKEIYEMLEKEAKMNLDLKKIYFKAKEIDFISYEKNWQLQELVQRIGIATAGTYRNIARTTGITYLDRNGKEVTKSIVEAYQDIVDDAIKNVATGKETFFTSLKNQLHTIGKNGIQSIEYESGNHRRIDSALRMNLQDGLNQLSIAQQDLVGEQFESDGKEITVHTYPAPDHADVQGHIFTDEEFLKLQNEGIAKDINGNEYDLHLGYESYRPIGELNCYHRVFSIVIGASTPRYTQEELDKINADNEKGFEFEGKKYSLYQGTQLQRKLELELRKTREEELLSKSALKELKDDSLRQQLEDVIDKNKERQNALVNKYHDLSRISGLPTKLERTRLLTK